MRFRIDQIRVEGAEQSSFLIEQASRRPCRGWAGIAGVSRLGPALIAIWSAWTLIGRNEGAKDGKVGLNQEVPFLPMLLTLRRAVAGSPCLGMAQFSGLGSTV